MIRYFLEDIRKYYNRNEFDGDVLKYWYVKEFDKGEILKRGCLFFLIQFNMFEILKLFDINYIQVLWNINGLYFCFVRFFFLVVVIF